MDKTAKQIAHEQRNAARKAEAAAAKAARMEAHFERNAELSIAAAVRRTERTAAHAERNERAALASATDAFAQAIEQRYGIVANDNVKVAAAA
jgi:hypothetical protein